MNFVDAIREDKTHTFTENGARAKNTSNDACLDFFSTVGSLRDTDVDRKIRLFEAAYNENPLLAFRTLFYGRDVRGGLGERVTFREILHHVAVHYPQYVIHNIHMIPFYGRWDDLYELLYTDCEDAMWKFMRSTLEDDLRIYNTSNQQRISLMAKWVKRGDESSPAAKSLGILTAKRMGYTVYHWKRIVAMLRKYIDIVEAKMSTKRWDEIDYSQVPSRASMIYRDAFRRHDGERYSEYLSKVESGEEKINASTLYPYDILTQMYGTDGFRYGRTPCGDTKALQLLWDNLPNYVDGNHNVLIMADTSGSMMVSNCRPFYTAVGLAIYFAQRNHGAYHNIWMTFSSHPTYQEIKGKTLTEIINNLDTSDWSMNTDLEKAFDQVLKTAIDNHVAPEDLPASIVVISDMEIDECEDSGWSFYDYMEEKYRSNGYQIPNIVFWNVNSRHDIYHADKTRRGVQLVSGQSTSTFKTLMKSIGMTPVEYMLSVLNSDRYAPICL